MAAFTRLALVALSGMSSRLLSRKRARKRPDEQSAPAKPATRSTRLGSESATVAAPEAPISQSGTATNAAPPVDPFRNLPARAGAPLVASIAARSLPVIGVCGSLITLFLGIGALRGELPYIGTLDFENLAWASALVSISLWAVYLLWKVPQWQAAAWARQGNPNPRELFEIENDSRGTLGQILSGVAVLTGLIFAWQQLGQTSDNLRVSEEGQITDRFSRAVDQLGSDQFTVRLGGIYALERIARDSPRDYGPVMEVLTAFARQESPLSPNAVATPAATVPETPLDVVAVFKVIGRRSEEQILAEMEAGECLDLTSVNAVGANLVEYDLRNTCWNRSDLRGAIMSRADLADARFDGAILQRANLDRIAAHGASFSNANLESANLSQSDLSDADLLAANFSLAILQGTNFTGANLGGANLFKATAIGADFSGANMLGATLSETVLADAQLATAGQLTTEQIEPALTSGGTTLPPGIDVPPVF